MDSRRTGWSLRTFLALVVVLLAWGVGRQVARSGADQALAQVLDGDLDRQGRLAALRVLRDQGVEGRDQTLVAAMAALLLNDRQAFEAVAERLPPLLVDAVGENHMQAALDEPCLRSLLAALSAESRGDLDEARALYTQAGLSARLWKVPLVEQFSVEGLQRLR